MPLGQYLMFTGSMLLALMFLSDRYIPTLSAEPMRADVDKTIIRIHSGHKWPEAIVFDTTRPTIFAGPVETAEILVTKSPRNALALAVQAPAPAVSKSTSESKGETNPVTRKRPVKAVRLTAKQTYGDVSTISSSW
jgi:hypothetical protein